MQTEDYYGNYATKTQAGLFEIEIKQESDCSNDGGFSFETTTNVWQLGKQEAKELIKELQQFIEIDWQCKS